jgi:hypothetical protein
MNHYFHAFRRHMVEEAANRLNANRSDIPGLWIAPGHPELTTAQLMCIAFPGHTGTPVDAPPPPSEEQP